MFYHYPGLSYWYIRVTQLIFLLVAEFMAARTKACETKIKRYQPLDCLEL